ncbi:MAG: gene transfer agent family protein [Rickettsiales bacterium]|nr:gene transfer agent family protein [Rickettsiales bacterium]
MVNVYRGEVSIVLDKNSYVMVPSFSVLVNIEEELNCSILDLVHKVSQNQYLSLKEIEVIIRCSIQDLNITNLKEVIYSMGVVNILPSVMKFIENSIGGNDKC